MTNTTATGATETPWDTSATDHVEAWRSRAMEVNRPTEAGTYYTATVPDTLDLAERARLGVNHFTEITSEELDYEMYWGTLGGQYGQEMMDYLGKPGWTRWGYDFGDTNPPVLTTQFSPLQACQPKAMEALAMLRLMSGSQQHLEREGKMVEMMASNIGEDGIFYVPDDPDKWWLGPAKDRPNAYRHGQGRMIRAMVAWYQYTGLPFWKEKTDLMVDGLDRHFAVHKDDYAYIPIHGWLEPHYFHVLYIKGRGWKDTSEPDSEKGERGASERSVFSNEGHTAGALVSWYMRSGNEQALRLGGEMVRYLLKPKFWADWEGDDYPGVAGAEHAHWAGHFHGYVNVLRSVLDYAVATNDSRLKAFVRDGYEWGRQKGLARIGLVGDGQGCGCGRFIGLAVKLTEAGVGDYWEDIDLYIRNHGTEGQFDPDDIPRLRRMSEGKPPPMEDPGYYSGDDVYAKTVGAFCENAPGKSRTALCCSPHGNMGLFYAWDGIVRYSDGTARVNLLLNRVSPWMDIDSYLPYEGKVVIRNKEARDAFVRIPLWVDKSQVRCKVGGLEIEPRWVESRLWFGGLSRGDEITIEFPMEERTETWTSPPWGGPRERNFVLRHLPGGVEYKMRFRGNTLVEIDPPLTPDSPLFQGRPAKYRATKAPMREVKRYVSPLVLKW